MEININTTQCTNIHVDSGKKNVLSFCLKNQNKQSFGNNSYLKWKEVFLGSYIQTQIIFLHHIQRTLPVGNFNIQHGVGFIIKITFTSHKAVSFRNAWESGLGLIL
jgi:hypothetical protein